MDSRRSIEADPGDRHQVRGEADEPGVRGLVGRSGLARRRDFERKSQAANGRTGPAGRVDDVLQHVRHHEGRLLVQHQLPLGPALPDGLAVGVLDPEDRPGGDAGSQVGKGGVRLRDLKRDHGRRTDRDRGHARHVGTDAEAPRRLRDGLEADPEADFDGHHVDGAEEGLPERDRSQEAVREVLGGVDLAGHQLDLDGGVVDDLGRRYPALDRSRVDERLEHGARLPQCLVHTVELRVAEVASADHGKNSAGLCVQGDEAALDVGHLRAPETVLRPIARLAVGRGREAGLPLHPVELRVQGRVGRRLQLHVERGVHPKTGLVDLHAVAFEQDPAHPLHEIVRGLGATRALTQQDREGLGELRFPPGDHPLPRHELEDQVAPGQGPLGMPDRGVTGRGAGKRCEQRGLRQGETRGVLIEIMLCGALHAVHAVEVDLVEVGLEDLLLRVGALEGEGHLHLPQLPPNRDLPPVHRPREHVAGQLLGDRAAAGAAISVDGEVHRGAEGTPQVDSPVSPETPIFNGDKRFRYVSRHGPVGDRYAALYGQLGQEASVGGVNARRLLGLEGVDLGNRGAVVAQVVPAPPREAESKRAQAAGDGEDQPPLATGDASPQLFQF